MRRPQGALILGALLSMTIVMGCGRGGSGPGDPVTAESTVRKCLDAWSQGKKLDEVVDSKTLVVTDHEWRAGVKLLAYKLTSEPIAYGNDRRLDVELTLEIKSKPVRRKATYLVGSGSPTIMIREDV